MSHAVRSSVRDPKYCTNQKWPLLHCNSSFSRLARMPAGVQLCVSSLYLFIFSRAVNQLFLNQINYIIHQLINPLSMFAEKVVVTQLLKMSFRTFILYICIYNTKDNNLFTYLHKMFLHILICYSLKQTIFGMCVDKTNHISSMLFVSINGC